ncbi:preprotein translocase subunit YajC [Wolbachia endosymbiont of Atemnus politus]|uniref:preprotein translocase subunit YajC n=1 Tax=Wolbachia endosymbiont of Atemnus politus TaxID=2682840 RepID=UPI0015737F04|nr:preprotein translocase subunit YajC [Wolbachia endosymbiont of Atemnus politus]NSX83745.1 preprotein translocase subunit YajC [Wolbachia endosymbiont of Atemnus politus]
MFISEVFAADAASNASSVGASFVSFVPLILVSVVIYFFIIRPNHKRLKEHRKINQVKRGDTVITSGGIIGEVNKVDEVNALYVIEIAPKVEIKVLKSAISEVLNKEAQKVVAKPTEKGKIEKEHKNNKSQSDKREKGKDNKDKNAS